MGGSSSQTVKTKLTPEQKRLIAATERLAKQQESLIGESADLARSTAPTLTGLAGEEAALSGGRNALALGELQFAQGINAPIQELLSLDQAQRILQGARPSDSQRQFLSDVASNQIASGQSDINKFFEDSLFTLREELAPSLGLRPGDTPIIDRGGRVAEEAQRLNAQLVNQARGQEAQGLLNFPLQEAQTIGSLAGDQLNRNQAISQFQQQLRQQSLINRAALQQQQVGQLAGLATGFQPPIGAALNSIQPTTTTTSNPGVLGFANALAGGVSALGAAGAFGCSKDFKKNGRPVSEILPRIKVLPVEAWDYREGIEDEATHIGPYAEDFQALFGIGNGVVIHPVDAFGVCLLGIKELTERVEALEA